MPQHAVHPVVSRVQFARLDEDNGGSLDVREVKSALRTLHDAAQTAAVVAEAVREKGSELRAKAESVRRAAEATVQAEMAMVERQKYEKKSVGAQLGAMLKKKGLKVNAIVTLWGGPDGQIDKGEFAAEVSELGLNASRAEMDELFESLDDDGGGTLDMAEMKKAMRTLIDECDAVRDNIKRLTQKATEATRAAHAAQLEWRQQQQIDRKQQHEQIAREEEAAEALEAKVAEEKAAKAAAVAKKKAAQEVEKAAFEAKVKARRANIK